MAQQMQLPAHLQNNRAPRLAERATEGLGSPLPPHISIRSNRFTLVDQAGDEKAVDTMHLDVCITDESDKTCKLYYGKDYEPGSTDPPLCFSANGIAPSRNAQVPQSPTCQECMWNIRGSATSKLSGAPIKACRDEKWLAVLIPGVDIVFQFRVTPGSFKNFKAYCEKFKNQPFDITDCITRLQFEKDTNGVITFQPIGFIDAPVTEMRTKALAAKATDLIVGRLDQPITALPAPRQAPAQMQALSGPAHTQALPAAGQAAEPAKRTRGRPPKAQEAAPAQDPGNGMAPFRPAEAPFGIAQNAPAPPQDVANEISTFFKS